MHRAIKEVEFVIFDVETTGLNPRLGDRICEIAAIKSKDGREISRFYSLVNPEIPMPQAAYEIHHISDTMLLDTPKSNLVLLDFLVFIKDAVLAGYNVSFDLGFIENELRSIDRNLNPGIPVIDILRMSRRLYPDKQSYSLANFSRELGLNFPQVHRAMQDVELTKQVFDILLSKIETQKIKDFLNMHNLFGLNLELINQSNNQKIAEIVRAIDLKVRLKIRYFTSSKGEITEREVTPKEIKQENNKQYLVGHCHLRNEERTFRIDSIVSMQI